MVLQNLPQHFGQSTSFHLTVYCKTIFTTCASTNAIRNANNNNNNNIHKTTINNHSMWFAEHKPLQEVHATLTTSALDLKGWWRLVRDAPESSHADRRHCWSPAEAPPEVKLWQPSKRPLWGACLWPFSSVLKPGHQVWSLQRSMNVSNYWI